MKVYVVQCSSEVISVKRSLESAQAFCERREGAALRWDQHRGHGVMWQAHFHYWINCGPQLKNVWTITEHELED